MAGTATAPGVSTHKFFTAEYCRAATDPDTNERTLTTRVSTLNVDRDREIVLPGGISLGAFKKNPVVLWAHSYDVPPIGKAQWIKLSSDKKAVEAKVQFPAEGTSPLADEVFELFDGGFLSAFSIGFSSIDGSPPTTKEIKANPEWAEVRWVHRKTELMEFSAVPVPSNREALVTAIGKGLHVPDELTSALGDAGADDGEITPRTTLPPSDAPATPLVVVARKAAVEPAGATPVDEGPAPPVVVMFHVKQPARRQAPPVDIDSIVKRRLDRMRGKL